MNKKKHHFTSLFAFPAAVITGLHFINRHISEQASQYSLSDRSAGAFYSWSHGKVFYKKAGNGPRPILLVHDADPISSSEEWKRAVPFLQKDFTVYMIDLPGCGRSDKPAITYINYFYARLICDFIRDVIQAPAAAAGVGLSSSFILTAANLSPELLTHIYMINPASIKQLTFSPDRKSKAVRMLLSLPVVGKTIYQFLYSRNNLNRMLKNQYFYDSHSVNSKAADIFYGSSHMNNCGSRFLRASLDGQYLYWDIRRFLSNVRPPVSLLYAAGLPQEKAVCRQYKSFKKDVQTFAVPNTKRFLHIEAPKQFSDIVRKTSGL